MLLRTGRKEERLQPDLLKREREREREMRKDSEDPQHVQSFKCPSGNRNARNSSASLALWLHNSTAEIGQTAWPIFSPYKCRTNERIEVGRVKFPTVVQRRSKCTLEMVQWCVEDEVRACWN